MDELLEFYTDTKPNVRDIFFGQLYAPFSLEPPAFHLLLHWTHLLIPNVKLAARSISICSLLIVEVCTWLITWKSSRQRVSALIAMLLPMTLVTIDYAPEARVYSLLTACLAVAILCWQHAVSSFSFRRLAISGLGLALGLATILHYYAIFLTLPLWAAEGLRTLQRRKLDRAILTALSCGTAVVALNLPFQHALAPFELTTTAAVRLNGRASGSPITGLSLTSKFTGSFPSRISRRRRVPAVYGSPSCMLDVSPS